MIRYVKNAIYIVVILSLLVLIFSCDSDVQKCPECEKCLECEQCSEQEKCPECEKCEECPEQEKCPECEKCEECSEQEKCPECEKCEECPKQYQKVFLGIDLIDENLAIFKDKRVGLITNPTGLNSNYKSSIDVLYEKTNLVALFAPEHGIRGNSQAGGSVGTEIDTVTNLNVYSLYGNTKKPTKEMMELIDILCIDIQDVGARFYTYIYTMAYAMQACAEYNKTFVIFDRPNPIGGINVDGNILNADFSSFVGMYPIITQHGMTIGELALLFNNEYDINCNLQVIKMKNWEREMYFDDCNIPWVNPSPNMPTLDTALIYPGTCMFEGLNLSEGRGTTKPFEFIGAPFIDPIKWVNELEKLNLSGVSFRPVYFTPTFEDYSGKICGGVQVYVTNRENYSAVKTGLAMIYTIKQLYSNDVQLLSYLKTLTGVDYIYNQTYSLNELFSIIDNDIITFKNIRSKYLLY